MASISCKSGHPFLPVMYTVYSVSFGKTKTTVVSVVHWFFATYQYSLETFHHLSNHGFQFQKACREGKHVPLEVFDSS
ncbi:hypothetical protein DITRI_Ditri11bG0156300 [Diplodiscus trichospermus]